MSGDLSKPIPAWKRSQLWERLADCITLLVVHGVITDGEKDKAWDRLRKQIEKQGMALVKKSPKERTT